MKDDVGHTQLAGSPHERLVRRSSKSEGGSDMRESGTRISLRSSGLRLPVLTARDVQGTRA